MPCVTVELMDNDEQPFTVEASYSATYVTDPHGTGDSPAEWDIAIRSVRHNGALYAITSHDEALIEEAILNDIR